MNYYVFAKKCYDLKRKPEKIGSGFSEWDKVIFFRFGRDEKYFFFITTLTND